MNKQEFDKKYKNKIVRCKTEELANEFLELADSFGFKWKSGDSLIGNNIGNNSWNFYKDETCYFVRNDNKFEYSGINFYRCTTIPPYYNLEIIEFESLKDKPSSEPLNKYQKAITNVVNDFVSCIEYFKKINLITSGDNLKTLIDATEKAKLYDKKETPMKIEISGICPNCYRPLYPNNETLLGVRGNDKLAIYCKYCGQKLEVEE